MPGHCWLARVAAALFAIHAMSGAGAATVSAETMARPEGTRHYLLVQPAQAGTDKLPLVIVLHGHSGSAAQALGQGRIDDPGVAWLAIADREHLLVLAPDGLKGSDGKQGWNDCRADATTNPAADDVGYIGALIDRAIAEYHADPERVFVTGISNGGSMTYRAAIELGPRLAAVAVMSASMPAHSLCAAPSHALPLLLTHGTADKLAPYAGGEVGSWLLKGRGSDIGVEASVKLWRELDRLQDTPAVSVVPHRDPGDATRATRYLWGADPRQLQVELLKIDGGGHMPPSVAHRLPWLLASLLGAQNGDVEFTEEAWTFFKDKRAGLAPAAQ